MLSNLVNKISSSSSTSISASESSNPPSNNIILKNVQSSTYNTASSSAASSPTVPQKSSKFLRKKCTSASNTPINSKSVNSKTKPLKPSAQKVKHSRAKSSTGGFNILSSLFHDKLKIGDQKSVKHSSESCDINTAIEQQHSMGIFGRKKLIKETNEREIKLEPTLEPQTSASFMPQRIVARFADEPEYRMNHSKRGYAVIINNKRFDDMPQRDGTDLDAACLESTLKRLDFDIKLFHNRTASEMFNLLNYYARQDYSDADCFLCVLLSHGDNDIIYGVDREIELEKFFEPFKSNRSLAGKPKLFFIQACRGQKLMDGIDTNPHSINYVSKIPIEADFLITYSTIAGYYSWRNSVNGTWFIQSLCAILNEHGRSLEIMQLLTLVNRRVAYYYESNASDREMSKKRQIPCIVSMLTKELYFKPKPKLY